MQAWPPSCLGWLAGVGGSHGGSPHMSVTYFGNHTADTSQETKRLPEPTVSCLMLDNMPTQPQKRWRWGPLQVPTLQSPCVASCGEWASPGPPWAGAVPRPFRPGLHWALAKPSSEEATWPQPPARALLVVPSIPRSWENPPHPEGSPCGRRRQNLPLGITALVFRVALMAGHSPALDSALPSASPQALLPVGGPRAPGRPPAPEGQGPSQLAEPLNTPGRPGCPTGGKEMPWGWDREQE